MESLHLLIRHTKSLWRKHVSARRFAPRGFTVLEMIVVLAIVGILTAVILVGQTTFNRTLLLTDTAYTVALSIRETQTLGLSSEKTLGVQNAAFGVHFSASPTNAYVQFADIFNQAGGGAAAPSWCPVNLVGTPASVAKPGNCVYDAVGAINELYHTFSFNQGFVQSFCAYSHVGGVVTSVGCSNGTPALSSLDIVFQRPNTSTIITPVLTSGAYPAAAPDTACIEVMAPSGTFRYIEVTQLGEVSVTQSCP